MTRLPTAIDESTFAFYRDNAERFARAAAGCELRGERNRFVSLLSGPCILDAGCGSGRDAAAFSGLGYDVTAIDASPEMIEIARRIGVSGHVLCLQDISWENRFDGIWACASLLHIPLFEIGHVARLLVRALKPGGVLFAYVKKGCGEARAADGRFFSYFDGPDISSHFEAAGLVTVDLSEVTKADSSGTPVDWVGYIGRKL